MSNTSSTKKSFRSYWKSHWQLYVIFMLPAVVVTFIFKYLPMGGVAIAFMDYYPLKGIFGSDFIGLDHFKRFLSSPNFLRYFVNTLKLSVYGLLLGFPFPIIIALIMNRMNSDRLKRNIQLIIYMPNFISVIVVCGIIIIVMSVTGPINKILGTSINFMAEPEYFRPIYILSGIWQGAGWSSILYTAALSSIDTDLIEAAKIDGANIFQQIRYVEWPAIKNIVLIQFILSAGGIMNVGFEKAYALQTPLNLPTSEIISTYVYKEGLISGNYSYSTAVGLFNTIINLILLILVNRLVSAVNEGEAL